MVGAWLGLASCGNVVFDQSAGGATTTAAASGGSPSGSGGSGGTGGGCTSAAACEATEVCVSYFCGGPPCTSPPNVCLPTPCAGAVLDCSCAVPTVCTGYLGCNANPDAGTVFCWNGG